jgi:hypothetical protein
LALLLALLSLLLALLRTWAQLSEAQQRLEVAPVEVLSPAGVGGSRLDIDAPSECSAWP